MEIIYLSAAKIPSLEANSVHVMRMCEAFTQNGFKTTLCCREGTFDSQQNVHDYYGIAPGNSFPLSKKVWPNTKGVGGFLYAYHQYHSNGVDNRNPGGHDGGNSKRLLYARDIYSLTLFSLKTSIPYIYEVHNTPSTFFHKFLEKRCLSSPHCLGVVAISKALKERYSELFPFYNKNKILVAEDGATLSPTIATPSSIIKTLPLHGEKKTEVGYVGHLYPGRGVDVVLNLAQRFSECNFHLIGGKESDVTFWKNQAQLKSLDNIFFYGHVPHGELHHYYPHLDIVLAPYQKKVTVSGGGDTGQWMSPLKIFEYFSHGKAIIASDLPVLREVLKHETNSLLVTPDDNESWANALKRLIESPELREQLGSQAKKELAENYSWSVRVKKIIGQLLPINID